MTAALMRWLKRLDGRVGRRQGRPDRASRVMVWVWRPVERRLYQSQSRSDAAAWADYTAGQTDEQIDAKMSTDPVFVRADEHARSVLVDRKTREAFENVSRTSMAATAVADPDVGVHDGEGTPRTREQGARRSSGAGTRRDKPRLGSDDDDDHDEARHGGRRGVEAAS